MNVRPIRNEIDLDWALAEISAYFDNEPASGTAEADRFDVLTTLISAYEARQHDVPSGDVASVLRYALSDLGHSADELGELVGSAQSASAILGGDRAPSLDEVARISSAWNLPLAALISTAPQAHAA